MVDDYSPTRIKHDVLEKTIHSSMIFSQKKHHAMFETLPRLIAAGQPCIAAGGYLINDGWLMTSSGTIKIQFFLGTIIVL